ncbi:MULTISPECIES: glutamate 5-kinase [Streptomyces]|uniref:glutamate 5-kinase n=1 Tax=Streptomyces TaxID=1883 RepID=UPI001CCD7572|nr:MULTISPECIES: glutamate 5-kinase [Streptomyces]UBI40947.1 glutamate 5-kinase [Streptomyces mobaraensis]UKW33431.1 glutamate 5-kinase [Streptomyces sp. TYQ1024]
MRKETNSLGNRVVIKVGTSSLVTRGKLDLEKVDALCTTVQGGIEAGLAPVLVTSGAIAMGRTRHHALSATTPAANQTAAALGQGFLYSALRARFAELGVETAQLLLTPSDLTEPERGDEIRPALELMHTLAVMPIVNENDVLGVRNNDVLAAVLSGYLRARLLLLLTDVAGLYDRSCPLPGGQPRHIPVAVDGVAAAEAVARGAAGDSGTGGMLAKLSACWIATHAGVRTVIAHAADPSALLAAYRGEAVGTVFLPQPLYVDPPDLGRLWRAFRTPPRGTVLCNSLGLEAIERGQPVRRADITAIRGAFEAGDVVDIIGPDARAVARGGIRQAPNSSSAPDSVLFTPSDYVQLLESSHVGD